MAVADINAAGGVLGKKLTLDVDDDACDPKQARSVAEKFAQREDPVRRRPLLLVVVDPGLRRLCRRQRAADHAGLDQSAVHRAQALERGARLRPRRPAGPVAGDYIAKNYKGKNIAILNDKTTYGKGLADETKKALNKAGVNEKLYESYNKGDKDFNALVSKLKRKNIDLVYVGGYHQEAGLILRQMRDQGMKTC